MTAPNKNKPLAAAVILTYNEECNIADTISNARLYFDTVFILDSFSTDKTVELATKAGARILENRFDNFASQRNFAIASLKDDFEWIYFLDADESIDGELGENLKQTISHTPDRQIAYRMKRQNYFLGKKIKYAFGSDRQFRLFGKFGQLKYFGEVHEGVDLTETDVRTITGYIIHKDKTTLTNHITKMNGYTSLEIQRRKTHSLKRTVFQLITVPFLTFLKTYIVRKGFLDGYRGFIIAWLASFYKLIMIGKQIEKIRQK
jgi:glycosyltransferase involved in cell wall biosynthesis